MSKAKVSNFACAPGDLRQIVLDYLCDNCYVNTAQVLAHESSTRELDKDGDEVLTGGECGTIDSQLVRVVQMRKEIKTRLLSGRIGEATELLNIHFPAVLSPTVDAPRYDPAHVFLNLKIQNFIEQSRTMPLPWPSDTLLLSHSPTHAPLSPSKLNFSDEPGSLRIDSQEDDERKNRLLELMNELYILTHALPGQKDRSTYLSELATIGGLLAYPVPETSREMRKYLNTSRREAVADQINEAILFRANLTLPSAIERMVRHTTILFSTLHSLDHPLPPPDQRPPGTEPFLLSVSNAPPRDPRELKIAKENDTQELVPKFELEKLLAADS